jgi:hypothetical protein
VTRCFSSTRGDCTTASDVTENEETGRDAFNVTDETLEEVELDDELKPTDHLSTVSISCALLLIRDVIETAGPKQTSAVLSLMDFDELALIPR